MDIWDDTLQGFSHAVLKLCICESYYASKFNKQVVGAVHPKPSQRPSMRVTYP